MSDFTFTFHFHALEKKMVTHSSVLAWRIPGRGGLVGCRLWGCTVSDTTEATWQQQQQLQQCMVLVTAALGNSTIKPTAFTGKGWEARLPVSPGHVPGSLDGKHSFLLLILSLLPANHFPSLRHGPGSRGSLWGCPGLGPCPSRLESGTTHFVVGVSVFL